MTFMAQRFTCANNQAPHDHMSILLKLKKKTRLRAFTPSKGEVAVTAGFVPFKVPGSPVVVKTVFPSPLSGCQP